MPRLLRPPHAVLAALFLAALGPGCGETAPPGGAGALVPGRPAVLTVSGTPYEMGWWQGRLLRERIRSLHARWRGELREALTPGSQGGSGGEALRRALDLHCDLCVDQTLHRLSERMLQELEGMAAGCGMSKAGLIRLDVMRDALRMKGAGPRLTGAVGLARRPGGYEARAYWAGPDADKHADDLLLVHRKPSDAPHTCVVSWPGSVGGIAGADAKGLGYVSAEGEVRLAARMGFGGGRPFAVAAREALENNTRGYDLLAEVTGTMGHAFLAFSMKRAEMAAPVVEAIASFHVYTAPDPPWVLTEDYIAVGPYEVLDGDDARALRAAIRESGLTPEAFWMRVAGHATPGSDAPHAGPRVSIRVQGDSVVVELGSASVTL